MMGALEPDPRVLIVIMSLKKRRDHISTVTQDVHEPAAWK